MPVYTSQEPAFIAGDDSMAQPRAAYVSSAYGKAAAEETEVSLSDLSTHREPRRIANEPVDESSRDDCYKPRSAALHPRHVPVQDDIVIVHIPKDVRQRRSHSRQDSQSHSSLQPPAATAMPDWLERVDEAAPPPPAAKRSSSRQPVHVSMPAAVRERARSQEPSAVQRQSGPAQPRASQPFSSSARELPGSRIYVPMPLDVRRRRSVSRDSRRSSVRRSTIRHCPDVDFEAARPSNAWRPDSATHRRSLDLQRSMEAERGTEVAVPRTASAAATTEAPTTEAEKPIEAERPVRVHTAEEPAQCAAAPTPTAAAATQEASPVPGGSTEAPEPQPAPPAVPSEAEGEKAESNKPEADKKKKDDGKCCAVM